VKAVDTTRPGTPLWDPWHGACGGKRYRRCASHANAAGALARDPNRRPTLTCDDLCAEKIYFEEEELERKAKGR